MKTWGGGPGVQVNSSHFPWFFACDLFRVRSAEHLPDSPSLPSTPWQLNTHKHISTQLKNSIKRKHCSRKTSDLYFEVQYLTEYTFTTSNNILLDQYSELTGVYEGWEDGLVAFLSRLHQHPERTFRTQDGHQVCSNTDSMNKAWWEGSDVPCYFLFLSPFIYCSFSIKVIWTTSLGSVLGLKTEDTEQTDM